MRPYGSLASWLRRLARSVTGAGAVVAGSFIGVLVYLAVKGQAFTEIQAVAIATGAGGLFLVLTQYLRIRERLDDVVRQLDESRTGRLVVAAPDAPDTEAPLEPLAAPTLVLEALEEGSCAIYAGSDFAVLAGMPHRERILAALLSETSLDDAQQASLYRELEQGNIYLVADVLAAEVGRKQLADHVAQIAKDVSPDFSSRTMRAFKRVAFSGAITDTWYDTLERLYSNRRPVSVSPGEGQAEPSLLRHGEFYVAHLYGSVEKPDSVRFPTEDYTWETTDREFSRFVASIFASRTVVFIGSTEREILGLIGDNRASDGPPHYALLPWDPGLPARTTRLERRGVSVLPFTRGDELQTFAEQLAAVGRRHVPSELRPAPPIRRIRLQNIGPFRELDLPISPGITVLLGDNGSGKSSILRAIALALIGENAGADDASSELLGEWPGALQPQALAEPYVNVSVHTAPTIRSLACVTTRQ